jgi:hypothetical protein
MDMTNLVVAQTLLWTYQDTWCKSSQESPKGDCKFSTSPLEYECPKWHGFGCDSGTHPNRTSGLEQIEAITRDSFIVSGIAKTFHSETNQRFTEVETDVREYVHESADVQLLTLNNYLLQMVHGDLKANMVIPDKSTRCVETDAISAFTWNNALVGFFKRDLYRPKPCAMSSLELTFASQT